MGIKITLPQPRMVALACNSSTRDAKEERSLSLGHLGLHGEFETSLGYTVRLCLKKRKKPLQNQTKKQRKEEKRKKRKK
jgi:hypothetical protein